jgi:hypothetical protein
VLRVFLMDLLARRQLCPIARFVSTGRGNDCKARRDCAADGVDECGRARAGRVARSRRGRRAVREEARPGGGPARRRGLGARRGQCGCGREAPAVRRRRSAYPCRLLPGAVRSPRAGGPGRGWPAAINSLPEDTVEEGAVEVHVARLEFGMPDPEMVRGHSGKHESRQADG